MVPYSDPAVTVVKDTRGVSRRQTQRTLLLALTIACTACATSDRAPVVPNAAATAKATPAVSTSTPAAPSGSAACAPAVEGKSAKRVGPPEVAPVTVGRTRFEVTLGRSRGLTQNGGYIEASNLDSRTSRLIKIYDICYDEQRERDVQDVFIASMQVAPDGRSLVVEDELGRAYVVDPAAGTARPTPSSRQDQDPAQK